MARVLMGDFGAVIRMGFWEILSRDDCTLLDLGAGGDILAGLLQALPDVVVLDLDTEGGKDLARRIARQFPAVQVVACSSERPTMRIYPRFHNGESYDCALEPDRLLEVVNRP